MTPSGWNFLGSLMSSKVKELCEKNDYTPFLRVEESFGTDSDPHSRKTVCGCLGMDVLL